MEGDLGEEAEMLLRQAGVELDRGLSDLEIGSVQDRFGFEFGPDHVRLLKAALPRGDRWPDWRNGSFDDLAPQLNRPMNGILFDVRHNDFWPKSWGQRPTDEAEAESSAHARILEWPRMIPVYGHRYMPARPAPSGAPILSIWQTDIIYYGTDLLDYLGNEFGSKRDRRAVDEPLPYRIPYWSRLVESSGDEID